MMVVAVDSIVPLMFVHADFVCRISKTCVATLTFQQRQSGMHLLQLHVTLINARNAVLKTALVCVCLCASGETAVHHTGPSNLLPKHILQPLIVYHVALI